MIGSNKEKKIILNIEIKTLKIVLFRKRQFICLLLLPGKIVIARDNANPLPKLKV